MDILPKGIGNALRQYLRDAMPGMGPGEWQGLLGASK